MADNGRLSSTFPLSTVYQTLVILTFADVPCGTFYNELSDYYTLEQYRNDLCDALALCYALAV
jgi:hypothetical protein